MLKMHLKPNYYRLTALAIACFMAVQTSAALASTPGCSHHRGHHHHKRHLQPKPQPVPQPQPITLKCDEGYIAARLQGVQEEVCIKYSLPEPDCAVGAHQAVHYPDRCEFDSPPAKP